jgi:hypothetical protein
VRSLGFLTGSNLLHSQLIPEYPCDGELIPQPEQSTATLRLLKCASCRTEITYTPDSSWVHVVLPGMKSDLGEEQAGRKKYGKRTKRKKAS